MKSLIQRVWGRGEGETAAGQQIPALPLTLALSPSEGEREFRCTHLSSIPRFPQ